MAKARQHLTLSLAKVLSWPMLVLRGSSPHEGQIVLFSTSWTPKTVKMAKIRKFKCVGYG